MQINSWLSLLILLTCSHITTPAIASIFDRPDFFERGREQFEAEIRRFEQQENIANPTLNIEESALPWQRVLLEKAGFTVMMPPGVITQETETIANPEGDIQFNIIATHPSSSRYVIAYSEEVAPERWQNTQAVLEQARDNIIDNNVGLSKIAENDFTFENYPGKQFQLHNENEMIVFRLLLVEQRLYVLAVNQQNEAISPELIEAFFDSFELLAVSS